MDADVVNVPDADPFDEDLVLVACIDCGEDVTVMQREAHERWRCGRCGDTSLAESV